MAIDIWAGQWSGLIIRANLKSSKDSSISPLPPESFAALVRAEAKLSTVETIIDVSDENMFEAANLKPAMVQTGNLGIRF